MLSLNGAHFLLSRLVGYIDWLYAGFCRHTVAVAAMAKQAITQNAYQALERYQEALPLLLQTDPDPGAPVLAHCPHASQSGV
ncbi:hypothetical protein [Sodalis-like endosymbiont of Proechinophthirus fluctus]|uniref:hypothetical protein n=1 Tax=Sodalis-like endosymbiont of Proechinophthirus fluctus TaxID=1462730 RepID=UPI003F74D698